jgi:adenylate cyclase
MDDDVQLPLHEGMAELFRSIVGLEPRFTARELAASAGVSLEFGLRVWSAFGMAGLEPDTPSFDAMDVESLRAIKTTLDLGVPEEAVIAIARVFGQVFSRLAESEQRMYNRHFVEPMVEQGLGLEQIADRLRPISSVMLPLVDQLLVNAHRRAVDNAIRQLIISRTGSATEPWSVCIVDLVDYASLSSQLDAGDLSQLVSRFEGIAVEECARAGTRLVKMIGDAALFVGHHPQETLDTAEGIVAAVHSDSSLPDARAGADHGEVLPMEGDYFGHPVNVAARLVAIAEPNTILFSRSFLDSLPQDDHDFRSSGLRELKGVGSVEVFRSGSRA